MPLFCVMRREFEIWPPPTISKQTGAITFPKSRLCNWAAVAIFGIRTLQCENSSGINRALTIFLYFLFSALENVTHTIQTQLLNNSFGQVDKSLICCKKFSFLLYISIYIMIWIFNKYCVPWIKCKPFFTLCRCTLPWAYPKIMFNGLEIIEFCNISHH